MKAIVYKDAKKVELNEVEDPRVETETDAVIRISTAGICGSDLHMYEGRTSVEPGTVLGHENMGIIEKVGSAVKSIRVGDRVVIPFNVACGFCLNCERGFTSACLTVNAEAPSGGYGYAGMGPYRGGQAELLRVPFADFNCLKLPGTPGDELEDDFLLLSDVFPTAFHSTELAQVKPGCTIAIFGAGPVGLNAALCSMLKGASEVYVVDNIPARLDKAREIGAIPIDFSKGDPAEQIIERRKSNPLIRASLRPGEEKMPGVMCGIDAVGYQAREFSAPRKESPVEVLSSLVKVINPTGNLGIVGVYTAEDPHGVNNKAKEGVLELPWGELFEKGIALGTGQCPVKRYNRFLRDLIIAGRAKPSFIVSHRLSLEEAPDAYSKFDERAPGYTKILLKPASSTGRKAA